MPVPDALVEGGVRAWGLLPERPRLVNPLDAYAGTARRWHDFRLKERVGFTLSHPELYGSMIIQDAKYLTSSELYVYDRATGRLHEHAASGGREALALPAELMTGGECRFSAPGYGLEYDFDTDAGRHVIRASVAPGERSAGIRAELELDAANASPPLAVSARLDERGATMFTHKRAYPAAGTVVVGERSFVFDPARDFAILDEHRSELPYGTHWSWGAFAFRHDDGRIAGANFAQRPQPAGETTESCSWTPTAAEPLREVAFAPVSDHPLASRRVTSADGRLDVTFTPEGRKSVRRNLGVVAIDYVQLFGVYEGELDGSAVEAVHGVCESMRMRA